MVARKAKDEVAVGGLQLGEGLGEGVTKCTSTEITCPT